MVRPKGHRLRPLWTLLLTSLLPDFLRRFKRVNPDPCLFSSARRLVQSLSTATPNVSHKRSSVLSIVPINSKAVRPLPEETPCIMNISPFFFLLSTLVIHLRLYPFLVSRPFLRSLPLGLLTETNHLSFGLSIRTLTYKQCAFTFHKHHAACENKPKSYQHGTVLSGYM